MSKYKTITDKFIFVPSLDQIGNDIGLHRSDNIHELMDKALNTPGCVGFNTLGYMKSTINKLEPSRFFGENDGIYVMRDDVVEERKNSTSKPDEVRTLAFIMQCLDESIQNNNSNTDNITIGKPSTFRDPIPMKLGVHIHTSDFKSNTNESCSTKCIENDVRCEDVTEIDENKTHNESDRHNKDVASCTVQVGTERAIHTIQKIYENDKRIMNEIFIETGAYVGDGIQAALDLGFKEVHSIELSEKYYNICKDRFNSNKCVTLHRGDSGVLLSPLIKEISDRSSSGITFWLDGHYSSMDTACADSYCSPIQQELDAIKQNAHPDHVILIDDMKDFTPESIKFNYTTNGKCGYVEKFQLENILSTIHPMCNTYYFGPACVSYSKNKL